MILNHVSKTMIPYYIFEQRLRTPLDYRSMNLEQHICMNNLTFYRHLLLDRRKKTIFTKCTYVHFIVGSSSYYLSLLKCNNMVRILDAQYMSYDIFIEKKIGTYPFMIIHERLR